MSDIRSFSGGGLHVQTFGASRHSRVQSLDCNGATSDCVEGLVEVVSAVCSMQLSDSRRQVELDGLGEPSLQWTRLTPHSRCWRLATETDLTSS